MEQNTNENMNPEEITKREKTFETLKKFFASNMKLKQTLLELAPTEKDDFSEETRMQYTDQLYRKLRDLEREFLNIIQDFEFGADVADSIKEHFNKAREAFLISYYDQGVIKKIYREQFADMSLELIETVKNNCIGYTIGRANLSQLIKSSSSINELLHVMHSYIINNENILQAMPVISAKKNGYYPITLYGEENNVSRKIFDEFPLDPKCGWTEIVSMKNKILMMIRDKGHALTIDMDISEVEEIFVKYFVPKLCNEDMIRVLPGINAITENGATGEFVASKEEITQKLFDFIEKVPTDAEIPDIPIDWSSITTKKMTEPEERVILSDEESNCMFETEQVKELAMESGENGRRNSALIDLKNRLKNSINKLKSKTTGKDFQQIGGTTNDETTRD